MISLADKQNCTGRMACLKAYPVKCISVKNDDFRLSYKSESLFLNSLGIYNSRFEC